MHHPSACDTLRRACRFAFSLLPFLSAIAHAQQTTTYRYQYDANGNLTHATDPLGHITRPYDALHCRIATTNVVGICLPTDVLYFQLGTHKQCA